MDTDPDPVYDFYADPDADPNSCFYLMRIRMWIRILILFDADADPDAGPGSQNDAVPDPDPRHCSIVKHT
jgi:hypothetical protein